MSNTNEVFPTEIENMRIEAGKLEILGFQALNDLLVKLPSSPLSKLSYAYTARVKPQQGLLEKVCRKRNDKANPKPNYSLNDITDVVGIRFVTLYRSQIPAILKLILTELTGNHCDDSSFSNEDIKHLFKKDSLREAILYHNQHIDASIATYTDIIKAADYSPETNLKAEYSSIHIVANLICNQTQEIVPIEIQIRTVFEDAWGQLNHKFKYSEEAGKSNTNQLRNKTLVNNLLTNLKKFTDACNEYADLISREGNEQSNVSTQAQIVNVKDYRDVIRRLKDANINDEVVEKYKGAGKLRFEAEELLKNYDNTADQLFKKAAESYELTLELYAQKAGAISLESKPGRLITYYCKLNIAFCYLTSSSMIAQSTPIYEELIEMYSDYPMPLYRLGQAKEKLGNLDSGLQLIDKAYNLARELHKKTGEHADCLPFKDYIHIITRAPLKLGFHIWSKASKDLSNEQISKNEFLKQLESAYEITNNAMSEEEHIKEDNVLVSLTNNLLYYSCEIVNINDELRNDSKGFKEILSFHLEKLQTITTITDTDVRRLETLARAYFLTGKIEKSKDCCKRVLSAILENKNVGLSDSEQLNLARSIKSLEDRMN